MLNLVVNRDKIKETYLSANDTEFKIIFNSSDWYKMYKKVIFLVEGNPYIVEGLENNTTYPLPKECIGNEFFVYIVGESSNSYKSTEKRLIRILGGEVSSLEVQAAVEKYLERNPVSGVTEEQSIQLAKIPELENIIKDLEKQTGVGIQSISKTATNGLIDTYTIEFTNDKTTTFQITNGEKGESGKDGTNGITPHIGTNGNWWIDDIDTGEKATADPLDYADKKYGISDTPVGHVISHIGTVAPAHYLICDGKEYNIVDYPYLTQHFIDNFGSVNYFGGDGETTFAVPDLRGEFLRGSGENSHTYTYKKFKGNEGSGSNVGVHQGATIEPIVMNNTEADRNYGWLASPIDDEGTQLDFEKRNYDSSVGNSIGLFGGNTTISNGIKGLNTIGTTRPTNTSVLYCIKYEPTYFIQINQSAETVNNLTTTEEGHALDATQGKALKDEVDTLNSINFGEVINIETTAGTTYTFQNNGYLQVFADYGANSNICVSLSGIEIRVTTGSSGATSGSSQCIYVKRGMRVNVVSSNGICLLKFFPLI